MRLNCQNPDESDIFLKKLLQIFLPENREVNYRLRRKAEYTALFLLLLTPYIIAVVLMLHAKGRLSEKELLINTAIILVLPLAFLFLKKGYTEFTINIAIFLGMGKALELMVAVNKMQLFLHVLLVVITAAAVHVKKYQIYTVYFFSIVFSAGKIILNHIYCSAGLISEYFLLQIYQSAFSGLFVFLAINFITGIIEREITLSCKFENEANTDSLTGAFNRRKFSQLPVAVNSSQTSAFCMIDIDYFKNVNDNWGHETGDTVLRELTSIIKEMLRDEDILYRWGGEEFLLILACVNIEEAVSIVERIRIKVKNHLFADNISITFSAGISMHQEGGEFMQTMRKADFALYSAKKSGRNRVETM